jgi:hypothetical protein
MIYGTHSSFSNIGVIRVIRGFPKNLLACYLSLCSPKSPFVISVSSVVKIG